MAESATLTELAQERAGAAERKLVDTEAKLGVTQNERDVAVKTAEAADAINQRLVGRIEEVSKEAGRLEGVNAVLKEKIQETPQQTRQPDQEPILEATRRRGGWGWLFWLILILLVLLAFLYYFRGPIFGWLDELFSQAPAVIHTPDVPKPDQHVGELQTKVDGLSAAVADHDTRITALETETGDLKGRVEVLESAPLPTVEVQQDPKVCTVPGSVYVDILQRCVHS